MMEKKVKTSLQQGAIESLRLILGDQLNLQHSWFSASNTATLYVIAEVKEETQYTRHHVQKVCAFFKAMDHFAHTLQKQGHRVLYLTLDDTQAFNNFPDLLKTLCDWLNPKIFEYQIPDEIRLSRALADTPLPCRTQVVDSEHFYLSRQDLTKYVNPGRHNRMESFYRKLRKRFDILMDEGQPLGGRWNYDSENRVSLKKQDLEAIPTPLCFANDVTDILSRLDKHQIATIGAPQERLIWPVNQEQALDLLTFFCSQCLPRFGTFQDAMTLSTKHRWSLYHSRLSFALNAKILSPHSVIEQALHAYEAAPDQINIAQIEGFIRQILGWREYIRAVYWVNEQTYPQQNALKAKRALPEFFWHGKTHMQCLHQAVTQSLDKAYAHHIQRLMITGNFCLLAGINPDEVDQWYLGIYIDAIEWVEMPNTRGMSQWADGGWVATKPYCSSGNYINKMSDYCKQCHYDVKQKTGARACPFNSLYWQFIDAHKDKFTTNPRMRMIYNNWAKQPEQERAAVLQQAKRLLKNLDNL